MSELEVLMRIAEQLEAIGRNVKMCGYLLAYIAGLLTSIGIRCWSKR